MQAYADALKQIAVNCSFSGAEYDNRLRDTFVAGIRDDLILQKLYEREDLLTNSLDQVLVIARTLEGARDSVEYS